MHNMLVSELTNALGLMISSYLSSKIFLQKLRDEFGDLRALDPSDRGPQASSEKRVRAFPVSELP
jgi:hypothetical protein